MFTKIVSIYNNTVAKLTGSDVKKITEEYHTASQQLNQLRLLQERTEREVDSLTRKLTSNRQEVKTLHKILADRDSRIVALGEAIQELSNKAPTEIIKEIPTFAMTEKMYRDLQKEVEPPIVTNSTTAHGVGYLLGIQRALSKIEERYVTR